jgi:hypothetical protein
MPDDESQESTSGILFVQKSNQESRNSGKDRSGSDSGLALHALFLNPRNMSSGELPTTIASDQSVGELHDSIELFAVRCSFHTRFAVSLP